MASAFIFNGALAGFMGGPEGWIQSQQQADYASRVLAAVVFASAVDAAIVSVPVGKENPCARLVQSLCQGVWANRNTLSVTPADYTAIAAAIAAEYAATLPQLLAESSGGGTPTLEEVITEGNTTGPFGDILIGDGGRISDEVISSGLLLTTQDSFTDFVSAGIINLTAGSGGGDGSLGGSLSFNAGGHSGGGTVSGGAGIGIGGGGLTNAGGCTFNLGGGSVGNIDSGFFTIFSQAPSGTGIQGHFYMAGPGSFLGLESLASLPPTPGVAGFWVKSNVPQYRDLAGTDHPITFT